MLVKNSYRVAECYHRAAESHALAGRSKSPADREFYLRMEQRWLQLAHSYGFADRNQLFLRQNRQLFAPAGAGTSTNYLLASLSPDAMALLQPGLKQAKFAQGQVLWDAERELDRVYFPQSGAISLAVISHIGRMAEVGLVGPWGAFGLGINVARGAVTRAVV